MRAPTVPAEQSSEHLPVFRIFAYVFPNIALAALGLPIVVHLPAFYASREMGLTLGVTGLIFSLCRIADVFVDPLMGYLSDRWRTPWGRRRPLIALGTPLLALGIWMVFVPGGPVSPWHLGIWLFLMYVGWSMVTIPHLSWGAELTPDYHERSRVYGWAQFAIILGMVSVLVMPALLDYTGGFKGSAQILAIALFALLFLLPSIALLLLAVPEPAVTMATHASLIDTIKFIFTNSALGRVIAVDLIASTSAGIVGALFFFFARAALELPRFAGTLILVYFISGVIVVPFWIWLARRIGKSRTLMTAIVYSMCVTPLYLLVPKGHLWAALPVFVLTGASYGASTFLLRAMMADVADADAAKHGAERAGVMYSLLTLTNKFGLGWSVGIGFGILGLLGFDPKIANTASAIGNMRLFFILSPILLNVLSLSILAGYPLDEVRQRATRAELDRRRAAMLEDGSLP